MSGKPKTHGMDKSRVEADWPQLTLAEVRGLFAEFPEHPEPVEILTVSPRPFSAASVIGTNRGRFFVKRHHRAVRDREGLLEEHRFMRHLRENGVPVPFVFANRTGETAIEFGKWTYEVHEAPLGVDIYEDALSWTPFHSAAHARSAGEALARLHLASLDFDAPHRKPRPLVASFTIFPAENPNAAMDRYLAARPALAGNAVVREASIEALDLLAPFHVELKPLLPALKPLWTHNDLHASNLLWSDASDDARAAAIIDFGLADRTNAVHDLAHTIERNIVEWLELKQGTGNRDQGSESAVSCAENIPMHLDHLLALLDGYESLRPLTEEEAAALAPMTALCHAEFALTEADYFLGVLHSEKNARVCAMDYLVGHARWFRSANGMKLLDAIRCWAEMRQGVGRR
ncbi:MAG: phosphotransferase [Terracidiphilus sp.]|jgi:Ser/Thr protein kinase RdoA (MazF antagonist)